MSRVTILAVAVAVVLFLIWIGQRRLVYFPLSDVPSPETVGLPAAEAVTLATDDGLALGAWFVPAAAPATGDTVLVFNGNAGNRAYRASLALQLARRGVAVLLFDYRGYGGNPGSPSERGLATDARAASRYLAVRSGVDPARIAYFGESLGAAVAVGLATERPPSGLILRSPFTSMTDVGGYHYPFLPVRWLLRDRYPSIDRIAKVGCPLLIVSAARDSVVPAAQSRRLYDAARDPKRLVVIPNVDHNDEELAAGPAVIEAVIDWLGDLRTGTSQPRPPVLRR